MINETDIRDKMGIYTYRVMHGKQTLMKTPDTPALARDLLGKSCKCVRGQVEQGAEGKPLRQTGDGRPAGPCGGVRFPGGEEFAEGAVVLCSERRPRRLIIFILAAEDGGGSFNRNTLQSC